MSLDITYRHSFVCNKENASTLSPNLIGGDRICKPKSAGGLGFRKAKTNNRALQMKLLWRIPKVDNNLWVKLVRKRYVKNNNIFSIEASKSASWQWRNMPSYGFNFKKCLRWQIGDGDSINFWSDNWFF